MTLFSRLSNAAFDYLFPNGVRPLLSPDPFTGFPTPYLGDAPENYLSLSGAGPTPPDALAPFLGQSTAVTTSVDRYRTAAGFTQSALDTWLGDDGHWYQITVTWNGSDNAVTAVRRIDQGTWTQYTGTFSPQHIDNDEHQNIVVFVDGSQRVWVMGGTHAEPIRWLMIPKGGGFVPTSTNAQFNRPWLPGDVNIPLETGATNENDVTYYMPVKFTQGSGEGDVLLFYRKGSSGEGQLMLKYLDHDKGTNGTWKGLATPLVDATADGESAYPHHIALSRVMVSGQYKIGVVWNLRRTGVATTAHDICVVFGLITPATAGSDATATWWKDPACTIPQTLPIRVTANTPTIVATVAEDHGMFDLGDITFDSTGLLPIITKPMCYTPADVHINTDTPHNVEYQTWEWNGAAWIRNPITNLNDTTTHYDSVSNLRETPACVIYNGLRHFYVNLEDGTGNAGMTRVTTANYLDIDYVQIAAPSGLGLGNCSTCLDYTTLARSSNRYAGFIAQRNLNTPVEVNRYVYFEDLSLAATPVTRMHRLWTLPGGASHVFAYQADVTGTVVNSGGTVTRWADALLGGSRHANQVGASSLQPNYITGTGGIPLVSGNGSSKFLLVTGYNPPAPATTNLFFYAIGRKRSHVVGSGIAVGQNGTALHFGYHSTSPQLTCRNGSVGATVASTNTTDYVLVWAFFTGATSGTADRFKWGATEAGSPGTFFGAGDPSALGIFAQSGGGSPTDWELYTIGLIQGGIPTNLVAGPAAMKADIEARYSGITINV